jgi:hypothetical protein
VPTTVVKQPVLPKDFDYVSFAARFAESAEFRAFAKKHATTIEHLLPALGSEIKRITNEYVAKELAINEGHVASRAIDKLRADLEHEKHVREVGAEVAKQRPQRAAEKPFHEVVGYNLPSHLARITKSKDFEALAKAHHVRSEDLALRLGEELKAVVAENRRAQVTAFEAFVAPQALADLEKKLKAEAA